MALGDPLYKTHYFCLKIVKIAERWRLGPKLSCLQRLEALPLDPILLRLGTPPQIFKLALRHYERTLDCALIGAFV